MKSFVVYSTLADPKRILAPNDGAAAVLHYVRAHFLNGGGPVENERFRVYDDEVSTEAIPLH